MMGFRFQDPLWVLLILPIAGLFVLAEFQRRRAAVLYSDVRLLRGLPTTFAMRLRRALPWLQLLGLGFLVLALARPQRGLEEFRLRTEGIAIEMCLDRSGSMQALDFEWEGERVNRLQVVKKVFREFVTGGEDLPGRPDDLIGLVAFGGFAESKCPLTLDHGALVQILETVRIPQPIKDSRGRIINARFLEEELATAIGDAVALAVERIKDTGAKSKVIILLSDGENTAGVISPHEAAEAARAFGIKLYAIGVGTTGRVPVPVEDAYGRQVLMSQVVRLDEKTLTELAETTGGRYFNARDTGALKNVYAEIDQLEKTETEGRLYTEYRELYAYALFPGLALILLALVLFCTRFRSLP